MKLDPKTIERLRAQGRIREMGGPRVPARTNLTAPEPDVPATGRLSIQVPVPPSVNEAYATVHGRRVLVTKGRDYKASVTAMCQRWEGPPRWLVMTITITMPLYFKNGRVRQFDASNRIKLLEDAVCEGIGIDDRWIRKLVVEKVEGPWGCLVTVEGWA